MKKKKGRPLNLFLKVFIFGILTTSSVTFAARKASFLGRVQFGNDDTTNGGCNLYIRNIGSITQNITLDGTTGFYSIRSTGIIQEASFILNRCTSSSCVMTGGTNNQFISRTLTLPAGADAFIVAAEAGVGSRQMVCKGNITVSEDRGALEATGLIVVGATPTAYNLISYAVNGGKPF